MYTINDIKRLEDLAAKQEHISELTLMQRAGDAAFNLLQTQYSQTQKIAVICGSGNNAGDGYVVATMAKKAGKSVICFYLKDPLQLKEPALTAFKIAQTTGVIMQPFKVDLNLESYNILIDALLGTGFKGKLQQDFLLAINIINQAKKLIISLDIPSGLSADTGYVAESAVKAHSTITFIALKQGLFTADALDHCGEISLNNLELPEDLFVKIPPTAVLINFDQLKNKYLQPRKRNSHKGDYGHVAVIGGDAGMTGAIRMASEASARVGAGLTSAYIHTDQLSIITTARPEVMAHSLSDPERLTTMLDRATVLAIGPGLGRHSWGESCFNTIIKLDQPKVIDADALWFLANNILKSDQWVLTPHPTEAARLLKITTAEVQADRFAAIMQLQKQYGGTIVLKGAGTLIYDGKHPIQICTDGNPGMASGGMGDVLTGLIAGLVAQHVPLFQAACLGVNLHARAGDLCAGVRGERGMLALDLLSYVGNLIN